MEEVGFMIQSRLYLRESEQWKLKSVGQIAWLETSSAAY